MYYESTIPVEPVIISEADAANECDVIVSVAHDPIVRNDTVMYPRDQYTMKSPARENLKGEVEAEFDAWVERGRQAEVEQQAEMTAHVAQEAAIQAARRALDEANLRTVTPLLSDEDLPAVQPLCRAWAAGEVYYPGEPLVHNGQLYRMVAHDAVTAQAHQPPDGAGMAAIYRLVDASHAGTLADPKPYQMHMMADAGLYYTWGGKLYRCKENYDGASGHMPDVLPRYFEEVV